MEKKITEVKDGPLTITGEVVIGDWKGDPGVGIHKLDPYVDDIKVSVDGTEITDHMLYAQLDYFEELLIEKALGRV